MTEPIRCRRKCRLFSECMFERKVEVRFGERTVTTSRHWKSCADSAVSSLIRLVLAVGLVVAACNLSCSLKSIARGEKSTSECFTRLQDVTEQVESATATLSKEVEEIGKNTRKCHESAKQLSATDGMLRVCTNKTTRSWCWFCHPYCAGRPE